MTPSGRDVGGVLRPEQVPDPAVLTPGAGAPPPPAVARGVFGDLLPMAEEYARLLVGPGVERGLIGPHEISRLWERHLLNSAVIADLIPRPCTIVDLGSGAGLPGIVLAMLLGDCEVTLLEPMLRRTVFLTECVTSLGLANARVLRGRAEDFTGKLAADVVTARAVAPLDRLAGIAVGLLRPGGIVLAVKGAKAQQELTAARKVLRSLRVRETDVLLAGEGKVDPAATVVRLTAP